MKVLIPMRFSKLFAKLFNELSMRSSSVIHVFFMCYSSVIHLLFMRHSSAIICDSSTIHLRFNSGLILTLITDYPQRMVALFALGCEANKPNSPSLHWHSLIEWSRPRLLASPSNSNYHTSPLYCIVLRNRQPCKWQRFCLDVPDIAFKHTRSNASHIMPVWWRRIFQNQVSFRRFSNFEFWEGRPKTYKLFYLSYRRFQIFAPNDLSK